jgi:hypothetical protein
MQVALLLTKVNRIDPLFPLAHTAKNVLLDILTHVLDYGTLPLHGSCLLVLGLLAKLIESRAWLENVPPSGVLGGLMIHLIQMYRADLVQLRVLLLVMIELLSLCWFNNPVLVSLPQVMHRVIILKVLFNNGLVRWVLLGLSPYQRIIRGDLSREHGMLGLFSVIIRSVRLTTVAAIKFAALHKITHLIVIKLLLLKDLIRVFILSFGETPPKEEHFLWKPDSLQEICLLRARCRLRFIVALHVSILFNLSV